MHAGEHFQTPTLDEFLRLWIGFFARSPHARLLWKERTGLSMATYSETRWWSRYEVLKQILLYFGDILPFLMENEISLANRSKLLSILHDIHKKILLQVELAIVVDVGEQFVTATYLLEGNGSLVFLCYETLSKINYFIEVSSAHLPNTKAIIKSLNLTETCAEQLFIYAKACVEPGLAYYQKKFSEDLKDSLAAFEAARLFLPSKIIELKPDLSAVDKLKAFPFLNNKTVLDGLKQELPSYLAKAADTEISDGDLLTWWKRHQSDLPNWSSSAKKVALVQPSSAAAERAFSILNSTFKSQQELSLQDYVECSSMLQYNQR